MKLFKQTVRQKSLSIVCLLCCVVSISASAEDISRTDQNGNADSLYVFEPLEVRGTMVRDVIKQPMTESPGLELSTTIVERSDIARQGAKTVIDAMEYVPGALVETRGRKVKQFFSIRGQRYPYPEYAVDGALFREFHEIPYFFSATDIERIEVLRSSAAMLSGISGLSGVINIIPREYTQPETSWDIEYGSFNTFRSRLSHGGAIGKTSYALSLDTPHTEGPSGKNAAEGMTNVSGTVRWRPSKSLSIQTNLFHIYGKREVALAEPPAALRFQSNFERFDPFETTFATLKTFYRPSEKTSTELLLYYADRDHTFISETDSTHASSREWDYEWGMNLVESVALSQNNTIRGGVYYNHWTAPNGKRFYVGRRCDLDMFSAVVVDEHSFGKLTMDAGFRMERTYIDEYGAFNIGGVPKGFKKVEAITDEWEPWVTTGSFGASYFFSPYLSIHGHVASGYIRPRRGTLDINHEEPENELRIKVDAGIRGTHDRFGDVSLVGFMTRQKNAIVLSGQTDTVDSRIMELYLNRDQNQIGVEAEARSAPVFSSVRLFCTFTLMNSLAEKADKMEENKELPGTIISGGINSIFSRCDFNIFWKYVSAYESARFAASVNGEPPVPQPLGDFLSFNLTAGRSFSLRHNATSGSRLKTRVYLEIRNIFDETFSTVVGYPDYGRRYTLGLRQIF